MRPAGHSTHGSEFIWYEMIPCGAARRRGSVHSEVADPVRGNNGRQRVICGDGHWSGTPASGAESVYFRIPPSVRYRGDRGLSAISVDQHLQDQQAGESVISGVMETPTRIDSQGG